VTKEEILAMEPGRKLDILIAKEAFGLKIDEDGMVLVTYHLSKGDIECPEAPQPYSTDISAAWQVLEKLQEKWRWITLFCDHGAWFITLENPDEKEIKKITTDVGMELPEAISKAWLLANKQE